MVTHPWLVFLFQRPLLSVVRSSCAGALFPTVRRLCSPAFQPSSAVSVTDGHLHNYSSRWLVQMLILTCSSVHQCSMYNVHRSACLSTLLCLSIHCFCLYAHLFVSYRSVLCHQSILFTLLFLIKILGVLCSNAYSRMLICSLVQYVQCTSVCLSVYLLFSVYLFTVFVYMLIFLFHIEVYYFISQSYLLLFS